MKIIIDIPNFEWLKNEEDFKTAIKEYEQGTKFDKEIRNALINSTPLPEHHGRMIDADILKQSLQENHDFYINAFGSFKNMSYIDKARVEEISNCIAEVVNSKTIIEGSESK